MTDLPTLSPSTQASVQGLVRAKNDLAAWTKNLEQALTDDISATPARLTPAEAAEIAKANDVEAPKAPKAPKPPEEARAVLTPSAFSHQQHDLQAQAQRQQPDPPHFAGTDKDDDKKAPLPSAPGGEKTDHKPAAAEKADPKPAPAAAKPPPPPVGRR